MGLDTTHDCWHGSYGTFMLWREALAKAAGVPPLPTMAGFGGQTLWQSLPPDILHVLLYHSDCEGEIEAEDCEPLAARLEELVPIIGAQEVVPIGVHPWSWAERTREFAAGLRLAASRGESVGFH